MKHWEHLIYGKLPVIDTDNSMGLIRYVLAIAVFIAHFNFIFNTDIYFPVSSYNAVGAFFALSGFLLYGSFLRDSSVRTYSLKRAKRILPPYLFIVVLCAFGLSAASSLGVREYFSSNEFFRYLFFNSIFLNFMEPDLPGVFRDSPIQAVNASLWTMKVEVMLYITVPIVLFASFRFFRKYPRQKPLVIFIVIYLLSMLYRLTFNFMYEHTGREIYHILGKQFFGQLMYFYSGVGLYLLYDKLLRYLKFVIPISLLVCWVGNYIPYYPIVLGPLMISVVTISLSSFSGAVSYFNRNNLSYDIYLFHFPIIQLIYQYHEALRLSTVMSFVVACIFVFCLSLFSWHLIEKPILNHRRILRGAQ